MRTLTILAVPLLLASCGNATLPATSPGAALGAQKISSTETKQVQAYSKACAVRVLVQLIENAYDNYGFITPGATCTNAFLGVDAMPTSTFVRNTRIEASADLSAVNVYARSKSRKLFVTTMDTDGNILFQTP